MIDSEHRDKERTISRSTSRKHREATNSLRSSRRSKEARKSGHKTTLDRFLNSPRYRASLTAIGWDEDFGARYDAIAAEDHSYIASQAEWSRLEELTRDCMRSMDGAAPDSTPRIKFDNDDDNNLLGQKRVPSVSTPKRVGGGTTIHQQVLWTERYFVYNGLNVFSLTCNGDSFVSDGCCTQDT